MHYHQDTRFATLKKIAEHSAEGVILFNLSDHTILYSNEVAVDLFGLREGATQVEVESLLENIAPEDKAYVINQYSTVDKKAITAEVEFRLTPDNSGRVVVSCTAYFFFIRRISNRCLHPEYYERERIRGIPRGVCGQAKYNTRRACPSDQRSTESSTQIDGRSKKVHGKR